MEEKARGPPVLFLKLGTAMSVLLLTWTSPTWYDTVHVQSSQISLWKEVEGMVWAALGKDSKLPQR